MQILKFDCNTGAIPIVAWDVNSEDNRHREGEQQERIKEGRWGPGRVACAARRAHGRDPAYRSPVKELPVSIWKCCAECLHKPHQLY